MEKVLNQAEMLAEAILESEEYISMRLAEQAAMRDENATQLIASYSLTYFPSLSLRTSQMIGFLPTHQYFLPRSALLTPSLLPDL